MYDYNSVQVTMKIQVNRIELFHGSFSVEF